MYPQFEIKKNVIPCNDIFIRKKWEKTKIKSVELETVAGSLAYNEQGLAMWWYLKIVSS